jgi:hypothetical protein
MMTLSILLYTGSLMSIVWGAAHIIATKSIVREFRKLSEDNRRIITMEWIAEGLTLCFLGVLVLLVTIEGDTAGPIPSLVYGASAALLLVMAGLTAVTGAKTALIPIKICPVVKVIIAGLFFLGGVA